MIVPFNMRTCILYDVSTCMFAYASTGNEQ